MRVVVVGSGASAVHFAQTVWERGADVLMVDVGREHGARPRPDDSFEELKQQLDDPVAHFLGERFEAVAYPGGAASDVFAPAPRRASAAPARDDGSDEGFEPIASHAQGGLAEAWSAGAYPYRREDVVDFPFDWEALAECYDLVAGRIGVAGEEDDLAGRFPLHRNLLPPPPLDEHARLLLEHYSARRTDLNRRGVQLGRARSAVLSQDALERRGCGLLGRCWEGCPTDSVWTPSVTLRALRGRPRFEYRRGLRAKWFRVDVARQVQSLVVERTDGSGDEEIPVERLALAAGTLETSRIVLESHRRATGERVRLVGLLDTRQVLVPFMTWRMVRRPRDPRVYRHPQVALALDGFEPREDVHAPLATLGTAPLHALVRSLPIDVRRGLSLVRDVRAALGVAIVSFADRRRKSCWVELAAGSESEEGNGAPLVAHYEAPTGEDALIGRTVARVRRALWTLGAFVPPGAVSVLPRGASAQYAGTLPMTRDARPFTTTPMGESRDYGGLQVVDGSTFPFLPARGPAFTLMANATRVARASTTLA